MKAIHRVVLVAALATAALCARAADGVAFITNLKGEVAVDGSSRPLLMSELGKGQRITVGKDAQMSVMYVQSGKEYVLKGPGDYQVGEREISSGSGMPPTARDTPWRANSEVLVKVAQTSSASIRMRSYSPVKPDAKPRLDFPTQGSVSSLQPTLRWTVPEAKGPLEVAIAVAGKEDKPVATAKVSGSSHRFPARLLPDTEYTWTLSASGKEIGSARFRTLPSAALQNVEKRKPAEKAEFTDRLLYALLLLEVGASQEAQDAWGKLAQERTDLPELAGLAK